MPEPTDVVLRQLGLDVSRETYQRLRVHHDLLMKWNPAINLVSPGTLKAAWDRHILDSAQVFNALPKSAQHWLDFGTGGGFPGLVCAILATEFAPDVGFTLVESDKRKSAFLSTAASKVDARVRVVSQRIESLPPQEADVVSARAVAPLNVLLDYAAPHLSSTGICIFPKGERHAAEVSTAAKHWRFKLDGKPSITDPEAAILVLGEIKRV